MKTFINKNKEDLKTILEVLIYGILLSMIPLFIASTKGLLVLCPTAAFLLYSIYVKIRRKKRYSDVFLIPTTNDAYYKSTYILLGLIAVGLGLFFILRYKSVDYLEIITVLLGVLLFVNGLLEQPRGEIVIQHQQLQFSGLKLPIPLQELNTITIHRDTIVLETNQAPKTIIRYLNIDPQTANYLHNYLTEHTMEYPNVTIKSAIH